jgi:hypothetical protein
MFLKESILGLPYATKRASAKVDQVYSTSTQHFTDLAFVKSHNHYTTKVLSSFEFDVLFALYKLNQEGLTYKSIAESMGLGGETRKNVRIAIESLSEIKIRSEVVVNSYGPIKQYDLETGIFKSLGSTKLSQSVMNDFAIFSRATITEYFSLKNHSAKRFYLAMIGLREIIQLNFFYKVDEIMPLCGLTQKTMYKAKNRDILNEVAPVLGIKYENYFRNKTNNTAISFGGDINIDEIEYATEKRLSTLVHVYMSKALDLSSEILIDMKLKKKSDYELLKDEIIRSGFGSELNMNETVLEMLMRERISNRLLFC